MRRIACAVAFVGRCSLLCAGLSRILESAGFHVVGSTTSVQDLFRKSRFCKRKLLLVLDSEEHIDDTVAQIALFTEKHPGGRVAVIADNRRADNMLLAFQAGAHVYLSRSVATDAFIKALELVMLGETILPPELLSLQGKADSDKPTLLPSPQVIPLPTIPDDGCLRLSSREDEILRFLVEGASNKVIARHMDIAEATVKAHVKAILRKIRVNNRTQAAIWAVNHCPYAAAEKSQSVLHSRSN